MLTADVLFKWEKFFVFQWTRSSTETLAAHALTTLTSTSSTSSPTGSTGPLVLLPPTVEELHNKISRRNTAAVLAPPGGLTQPFGHEWQSQQSAHQIRLIIKCLENQSEASHWSFHFCLRNFRACFKTRTSTRNKKRYQKLQGQP